MAVTHKSTFLAVLPPSCVKQSISELQWLQCVLCVFAFLVNLYHLF